MEGARNLCLLLRLPSSMERSALRQATLSLHSPSIALLSLPSSLGGKGACLCNDLRQSDGSPMKIVLHVSRGEYSASE